MVAEIKLYNKYFLDIGLNTVAISSNSIRNKAYSIFARSDKPIKKNAAGINF
jgi:hypothetical protein